ncbi:hypothetical protein MRX96_036701 [Rhipicephalus microplus]
MSAGVAVVARAAPGAASLGLGVQCRISPVCATADIKVGSYIISRGSIVIVSFWSLLHDKSVWGDPEVFRPERFLVDGGTRAVKPQQFIPFSYGKRSCPGESIASIEAFLYLTTVLKNFAVEAPPRGTGLVFDEVDGIYLRPKPQKLIF